ncbi:hypothetical protein ACFQ58_03630 [Agromyces sp. NPDC056523]|uniref:hypothetical protein n=1 Tax=Agromyces sp. NPDC056523 TaxID=3345850 RepID=UPI003670A4DA
MIPQPGRLARWRSMLGLDDPYLRGLLILLWATTTAYVVAHLSHSLIGAPWHPYFHLGTERGYAELFFQMLTGWTAAMLVVAGVRRRSPAPLVFAAFSLYLLADDYFRVHEQVGTAFGIWFDREVVYLQGLATHLGEALFLLGVGAVVITTFVVTYRTAGAAARRMARILAALYAALAIFGFAVDVVHAPFIDEPIIDPIFIAIEDGGEIAVASLIVVHALALAFGPLARPDEPVSDAVPIAAPEAEPTR